MKRNCCEVIWSMIEKIPTDQTDFRKALQWNYNDAMYKAPEETLQWRRTQETLYEYIPAPTQEWQFEVLSIFTTKPAEELKKLFKKQE